MISANVITRNEERNIEGCLASLAWCDEIIVVDARSTDDTARLARDAGARVVERDWSGYSDQRNAAIELSRGDFILYLDADECLGPGFEAAARNVERLGPSAHEGYWVHSLEYFMGAFLRHGGYGLHQANKKVRLWRNRPEHRFVGAVHERVSVSGPLAELGVYVEHYSSAQTVSGLLAKLNQYTDLEAESTEAPPPLSLVTEPAKELVSRYLKHQGFRDGTRGLVMAGLQAFYRFAAVAKRVERSIAESPSK
jgi:glycosyltransferase involved in cell wall biosynthesis